jgi:DNA-directed RNA polymerase specialized sigma24 family protein
MSGELSLLELLTLTLEGNQEASAELLHQLLPVIRRAVRVHLPPTDPLRRLFDSLDISQSVLITFLAKAGAGAIGFHNPEELRGLLRQMAAQKFIDKTRSAEAECRDHRREVGDAALANVLQPGPRPDEVVADRELYQSVRGCLTHREREMADLWVAGHQFQDIAAQMHDAHGRPMKSNTVRMALERAFHRVAGQLSRDAG